MTASVVEASVFVASVFVASVFVASVALVFVASVSQGVRIPVRYRNPPSGFHYPNPI